jgi:hypothetical protein
MEIAQACIFMVVENFLKILAETIDFWGAESKTELFFFSVTYHFPKTCTVNNFRYVYTGLMNLMRKCVQIKDELGQMYTYLFTNY